MKARILVLLTGGEHHVLHLAPLAGALASAGAHVSIAAIHDEAAAMARGYLEQTGGAPVPVRILRARAIERLLQRAMPRRHPRKSLRLLENLRLLRGYDAVLVAERTSAFLRTLRLIGGVAVHIPHGAGDRAGGYDARSRRFHYHIVSGEKDREAYIARGLGRPETVFASGSIKLAGIARAFPHPQPLFAGGRPTILYNPHFEAGLSSFDAIGLALLERFRADAARNYVFAPHIRLAERLSGAERAALERMAAPNLMIDLGSARSSDMSYTRACDIYLGDVSSQVYEFLSIPRPCVFANPHGFAWEGDPHFRFWRLGEVAETPDAIMAALARAPSEHPRFAAAQRAFFESAMGANWCDAPARAARRIEEILAYDRRT